MRRSKHNRDRVSERQRVPQPLIRRRLGSGRGATEQPNATGDGEVALTPVFWAMVALFALLFALFALKPLVTALCLGSGTTGGLFTPTMSTGAVLCGFLGMAWSLLRPGTPVGAYAIIGAAAMIGAAMQAPLAALALVLELTHSGFPLMIPMMAATMIATATSRYIDGYSIYSARLPAE